MRWRRAAGMGLLFLAGAGMILVAVLLTKTDVFLAKEQEGSQSGLPANLFERSLGRHSVRATRSSQGGDERGHGKEIASAPVVVERTCPYAIETEEEAILRVMDTSLPGNVVTVENLEFCRTGNHFSSVFHNLAVGYCCKSRVLWLPPKDDILAPGIFNEGTPGPRWFDFSSAPDVPGFNSSQCTVDITWAGQRAFHMDLLDLPNHEFYNPALHKCVSRAPRLVGCEAAYYFPTDIDVCSAKTAPSASAEGEHEGRRLEEAEESGDRGRLLGLRLRGGADVSDDEGGRGEDGGETMGTREDASSKGKDREGWDDNDAEEKGGDRDGDEGRHLEEGWTGKSGQGGGDGTLVVHIRSGDIFDDSVLSYYGQPPLQLYLRAIEDGNWDRVEVVTNGRDEKNLNPVIPALQAKLAAGELPGNVHIHLDRSMDEDLRSMFCADGLVLAKSTLVHLVGYHSRAKRIYGPLECNVQLNHLALHRPEQETYGLVWPGKYSVYVNWENTPFQREEMVAYDKISGFSECVGE